MQRLNYFTLKLVAQRLDAEFAGGRWVEAFSQQKDELIIVLEKDGRQGFLRVSCANDFQYLIPQNDFFRARSNTVNLFQEIENQEITAIEVPLNERILAIRLEGSRTVFCKMHGSRANIILTEKDEVRQIFRKKLTEDLGFQLPQYRIYPWDRSSFNLAIAAEGTEDEWRGLQRLYRVFDPLFIKILKARSASNTGADWESVYQIIEEAQAPPYYVGERQNEPVFLLLNVPEFAPEPFDDLFLALNEFLRRALTRRYFNSETLRLTKILHEETAKWSLKAKSANKSLEQALQARPADELANLIMANLHLIRPGSESVTVDDFYTGGQTTIRLKPELTAAENAAELYKKHRESGSDLTNLEKLAENYAEKAAAAEARLAEFQAAQTVKLLRQFLKKYPQYAVAEKAAQNAALPFRVFSYEGYAIWVGKNARNNDLLTVRYAHKDDLWLHAKDVPGSHVVVKKKNADPFPPNVVEYAAGVAAYFSKERNNSLVTVTVTPRKNVRKNKTLAPGEVIVEREETVLVKPIRPSDVSIVRAN